MKKRGRLWQRALCGTLALVFAVAVFCAPLPAQAAQTPAPQATEQPHDSYTGSFEPQQPQTLTYKTLCLSFVEEGGTFVQPPVTLQVVQDPVAGWAFCHTVALPDGCTMTAAYAADSDATVTVDGNTVSGTLGGADSYQLTVTLHPVQVAYTVEYTYLDTDGAPLPPPQDAPTREQRTGSLGALSEVAPPPLPGYTLLPFMQQTLQAEGTVVAVTYQQQLCSLNYSTGASAVAGKQAPYGSTVTVWTPDADGGCDPAPQRPGYRFTGWYLDAACTQAAPSSLTLCGHTTVYAGWQAAEGGYTVVYLLENADDDGYAYAGSLSRQAQVGSTVTETAATAADGLADSAHFTFQSATTATVQPDGSTVVEVRYSRNVYTLTSHIPLPTTEGERYLTLSAKYQAQITRAFEQAFNQPTEGRYAWSLTTDNDDKIACLDTMPGADSVVYQFGHTATNRQELSYWLENYQAEQTVEHDGKSYGLYKAVTVNFNYLYDNADFYPFPGYTKAGYTADQGYRLGEQTPPGTLRVNFFYDAQAYPLHLYSQGQLLQSAQVKLGSPLQPLLTTPAPPVAGAVFAGWYTDPQLTVANTAAAMPMGLALYAKWQLPDHTVTFYGAQPVAVTVPYGGTVTPPKTPQRPGHSFLGWYQDSACSIPFDFGNPIVTDTCVYARWAQDNVTAYTVRYLEAGSEQPLLPPLVCDQAAVGGTVVLRPAAVQGYFALQQRQCLQLQADPDQNVITFYYSRPGQAVYTVEYVAQGSGQVLYTQAPQPAPANVFYATADAAVLDTLLQRDGYTLAQQPVQRVDLDGRDSVTVTFALRPQVFHLTYTGLEPTDTFAAGQNPTTYTVAQLEEGAVLTLQAPSRPGYTFAGWSTTARLNGQPVSGLLAQVTIGAGTRGDLSFAANWLPQAPTGPTDPLAPGQLDPTPGVGPNGTLPDGATPTVPANTPTPLPATPQAAASDPAAQGALRPAAPDPLPDDPVREDAATPTPPQQPKRQPVIRVDDPVLTQIDDDALPLGGPDGRGADSHTACARHFLLLLVALALELWYCASAKKSQLRIFAARAALQQYDLQERDNG